MNKKAQYKECENYYCRQKNLERVSPAITLLFQSCCKETWAESCSCYRHRKHDRTEHKSSFKLARTNSAKWLNLVSVVAWRLTSWSTVTEFIHAAMSWYGEGSGIHQRNFMLDAVAGHVYLTSRWWWTWRLFRGELEVNRWENSERDRWF